MMKNRYEGYIKRIDRKHSMLTDYSISMHYDIRNKCFLFLLHLHLFAQSYIC